MYRPVLRKYPSEFMRRIKKSTEESSHSIGEHNYYIKVRRKDGCPKCKNGSKIVHESELK